MIVNTNRNSIESEEIGSNRSKGVPKTAREMGPMTVDHERWEEFYDQLVGPDGCNFHLTDPNDRRSATWNCDCTDAFPTSKRILGEMGLTPLEIVESIAHFRQHGGFCDCEVFLNVDQSGGDEDPVD